MKCGSGGGLAEEGELIEVVEMTVEEVKKLLAEPEVNATPVALYGLMWFLAHKSMQFELRYVQDALIMGWVDLIFIRPSISYIYQVEDEFLLNADELESVDQPNQCSRAGAGGRLNT